MDKSKVARFYGPRCSESLNIQPSSFAFTQLSPKATKNLSYCSRDARKPIAVPVQ